MNFTLIAYKSDSSCVCMGHVTDSYSSDFHISHHDNLRSLIEKRMEYLAYTPSEQESDYEIHMLYDGMESKEWPLYLMQQSVETERALKAEQESARIEAAAQAEREALDADRIAMEETEVKREKEATAQKEADHQTLLNLAEKLNFTVTPN